MSIQEATRLLKEKYLKNIKENPQVYVGVELEFPIVELHNKATDTKVTKKLFKRLVETGDFQIEKKDEDGNPIQLIRKDTEDRIVFELSYNTIEFAFEKAKTIQEIDQRFKTYLGLIQPILREDNHEIQGRGIHPMWDVNDNRPVKIERYKMLMNFLKMSTPKMKTHDYPNYGAFICGNQVQLDVAKSNYIRLINVFNKIEPAKAYLFANSEFNKEEWETRVSRDIFWEESLHGFYTENVGVNPFDFQDENDFFSYLAKTAMFTVIRDQKYYYFEPIRVEDYLDQIQIKAWDSDGIERIIAPKKEDIKLHRSYQFQDLTERGTIEFRSVCTQTLEDTFYPIAFQLGVHSNLDEVERFLKDCTFFKIEGRDYKQLRKKYSGKNLTKKDIKLIEEFSEKLLEISKEGLKKRNLGEEIYLKRKK